MPTWTLGEIGSEATARIGYRADLTLSTVSLWINQAIQDFVRDVPELLSEKTHWFSLSSGDSLVSLPTDWAETIVISNQTTASGSCKTIRQIAPEVADAKGYWPVAEPSGYFIYHSQIQFHPSANSSAATTHASSGRSYLHRYRAYPSDITDTAHVPSVATEHRKAVLYKTEVHLHERLGNLEEAALAEQRYLNYVISLKDAFAKRQMANTRFAASLPLWKKKMPGIDIDKSDEIWLRI